VVSCLSLNPRFAGSNSAEDDKTRNTSFVGVVKSLVPYKICGKLKNPTSMKEILRMRNSGAVSHQISHASLKVVSADNLTESSGV
jgi:hypothetical protein